MTNWRMMKYVEDKYPSYVIPVLVGIDLALLNM